MKTTTVALVGNPNTGKTTLFNRLAGMRQRVGNYPGVTVETKKGRMTWKDQVFDLVDLPGTYSLAPRSPDEMVAVDLILGHQEGEVRPDVIVSIVDASNLERNLYLTTQVLELGVPVVIALNMIDLARTQGMAINVDRLSQQLGVPVVPIQANKGIGLDQLKQAIADSVDSAGPGKAPAFPEVFERETDLLHKELGDGVEKFLVRRLLLDVGGYVEARLASAHENLNGCVQAARERLQAASCPVPAIEARTRYGWIRQATAGCIQRPEQRPVTWTDRIDRVLTHRLWGTFFFLVLMFLVFWSIFEWAKPLMDAINAGKDALANWLEGWLPARESGPLTSLVIDGILKGVGSVVVFLPQIMILFGFIAILEDCGYMARAAYLMDRLMSRCGLSGKSFIPMLSSLACAIPGIMAARVIENRRDRLTTILVAPLMSCSARLPVYILLIAAFIPADVYGHWAPPLTMFCMYLIGIVTAPLVALLLKRTLLRGETPVFVMEMPLYKRPSLRTVLRRMAEAGWAFVYRAGTLILASMIVVWALLYFPSTDANGMRYEQRLVELQQAAEPDEVQINAIKSEWKRNSYLGRLGHALEPVVQPLGWDWRIGTAALASFPAREVVVGTLGIIYSLGEVDPGEIKEAGVTGQTELGRTLQNAVWEAGPQQGQKVFTLPTALSLMVFFALCAQCASTLAVIRRETRSWGWPVFTFVYMTGLAYLGALIVYQVGTYLL